MEVIVLRGKKPVAKLIPISAGAPSSRQLAGIYRGLIKFEDKALEPLSDAEVAESRFEDFPCPHSGSVPDEHLAE